uniref:Uncharacterized protein n=1 Tax=Arundo donax TaxID=35708 RepID=A0A0A9I1F6_ARUDO
MDVRVRTVSAADMMDLSDRSLNDSSVVQAAQAFINEAMEGSDVPEESPPIAPCGCADRGRGQWGGCWNEQNQGGRAGFGQEPLQAVDEVCYTR